MTYKLSEAAAKDIEDILEQSLLEFGPLQTERYYKALKRCLELLSENPGLGITADDIRPGYRRFAHKSHVIFFRDFGGGMLVVRILHERMDVSRHIEG